MHCFALSRLWQYPRRWSRSLFATPRASAQSPGRRSSAPCSWREEPPRAQATVGRRIRLALSTPCIERYSPPTEATMMDALGTGKGVAWAYRTEQPPFRSEEHTSELQSPD